jgi:lipopolysaccharide biosynthesis glycosyltransferase
MKTAIVTSFDSNYMMPSQVSLKSLSENYHGESKLDVICLVEPNLLDKQEAYIKQLDADNLNIEFRCSPKYLDMVKNGNAHGSMYITPGCNHRIYLGSTLPDYDKAIYIDPDTLVLRDISMLLDYPLRNKLLAIVELNAENVRMFSTTDRPYFNNGVFIADLNYWRESGAEEIMNDFTIKYGPTLCPEQDAMNFAFIDVWSPLPYSFNTFHYWIISDKMDQFTNHNRDPLIIHFVGPDKPWYANNSEWERRWHDTYKRLFKLGGK